MMKLWLPNNTTIMLDNKHINCNNKFEKRQVIGQPTKYTAYQNACYSKRRDNFVADRE